MKVQYLRNVVSKFQVHPSKTDLFYGLGIVDSVYVEKNCYGGFIHTKNFKCIFLNTTFSK